MRSTSPPAVGRPRPAHMAAAPPLAEVIQLHPPTAADPADRPAAVAGDQLALPLLIVIDGGGA